MTFSLGIFVAPNHHHGTSATGMAFSSWPSSCRRRIISPCHLHQQTPMMFETRHAQRHNLKAARIPTKPTASALPVLLSNDDDAIQEDLVSNATTATSSPPSVSDDLQAIHESTREEFGTTNDLSGNISTSIFLLNTVAIIWGTQHSIIKTVVDDSDAAIYTFLRFSLAATLAALPIIVSNVNAMLESTSIDERKQNGQQQSSEPAAASPLAFNVVNHEDEKEALRTVWRWGLEMGLWMFAGFSFQAIGLLSTTAQRSGFLLYLNVKLVPLFAKLFYGRYISTPTWISAIAAFTGTAMLALDGQSIGFNAGDVWSILAAAASAMFILRLETASVKVPNAAQLNASSLIVVAVLSFFWMLLQVPPDISQINDTNGLMQLLPTAESLEATWSETQSISKCHPLALLYLGGVSTALSNFIQTKAQKNISAERASIIYSLDPVYGGIFAWLWLGENLGGIQSFVGAALITVAAATNAFLDLNKSKED